MKQFILLIWAALALDAGPMALLSGVSAGGSNNIGGNMLITPYPDWAVDPVAHWISYDNTGFGGIVAPNSDMSTPTATFYQDFELTEGTDVTGSIQIWADDFATVKLDGIVIFAANTVLGPLCAAGPIGCTQANGGSISFSAHGLSHRLQFDVYQKGLATFGLLYNGQVESAINPAPEPITFLIVGFGLACFGLGSSTLRRRAQTSIKREK